MALAKYREDIEERWLDDNVGHYEASLTELFRLLPPRSDPAGEVYLTRSGRRMEDIEVCEVSQLINMRIFRATGAPAPEVSVEEGARHYTPALRYDGTFDITFLTVGQKQVQVSSGGYIKSYTIYAVESFHVEQQPDVVQLLQSLTDFPPNWTDESFQLFRSKLEVVLHKLNVSQIFIDGVVEYFFGLFHEEQQRSTFRERLQISFGKLRWFIPYSDIARIICTQYFFCANEFAAAEKICPVSSPRLRKTLNFFIDLRTPELKRNENNSLSKSGSGVALLVALPDLLTFQAVEAIDDNRLEDAIEICAVIRKQMSPAFSRERAARLDYIEARIKETMGDKSGAKSLFENLLHSPWSTIQKAAVNHLN